MKLNLRRSSIGILLLALPLMGSVFLNIVLYNSAQQYYRELNLTRLDPLGVTVYAIEPNQQFPSSSNKLKVVFFGDSRAAAWLEPPDLDQFEFINRGIGSQTTPQILERYDNHILPLTADILVLQMGINDLKTIALFPDLQDRIITQCQSHIQQIVRAAQKQKTIVILSTIFPVGEIPIFRRLVWSKDVDRAIDEVNKFMKQLAAKDVLVFDTQSVLANENGVVKDEYSLDFLHLNKMGYQALNQELVVLLQEVEVVKGSKHSSI